MTTMHDGPMTTATTTQGDDVPAVHRDLRAAAAGAVAVLAAFGVSELIAGILPGATSLVAAVGQAIIDRQPPGAKDLVVGLFGTNDKLAFELFIVTVGAVIGALLGLLARRHFNLAAAGFIAFGVLGFLATLSDPLANPAIVAASAAVAVGIALWLLGWFLGNESTGSTGPSRATMPDWSRRTFLLRTGAVGVGAVVAGIGGRRLLERQQVAPAGAGAAIPPASGTVAALASGADLSPTTPDLTPIVIPNDRFYRIDTTLLTPSVDTAGWTLRIHGLVDRETTLTWDELIHLPMFEQYVTISCVSNEVGGNLVGNAKWTGVRLRDVLALAGVQSSATQLIGRSVDGWTAGMPMEWVMDPAREPMIAVKMNDEALPPIHGYPARLIVPGLYGYVSATKWLTDLEVTTWDAFDGYWITKGWSKKGPILTQSRIDTPQDGSSVTGRIAIAGVAWAPDRGIAKVEVAIDGTWRDARLSMPISNATWVQWVADWDVTPGDHTIQVRATDGKGETQTDTRTPPAPDGARGWDTAYVRGA